MSKQKPSPAAQSKTSLQERILECAKHHIMERGFNQLRMEDLADKLGISKKTLYVHFPGKNAIVSTIIDAVARVTRARLEAIVNDPKLTTADKICLLIDTIGTTMNRLSPTLLRDLKAHAPELYGKLDEIRRRNIPLIFGRLLQMGIAEGTVHKDIDPDFACEFWLHALRGLLDPETLERSQRTPRQSIAKAADLFFNGLLTDEGRVTYHAKIKNHISRIASGAS